MINVYASKIPMAWVSTKTGDKIKFLEFKNAKNPKANIYYGLRQTRPEGFELSKNFDAAMIEAIKAKGGIKTNMIVVKGVDTKYTGGKLWMLLNDGCEIIVIDAVTKTPKFRKVVNGTDKKVTGIEEDWDPTSKYMDTILHDANDLKDESTIKQFVEFTGLPKVVVDIWKYAKSNLHLYPTKLTDKGMVYPSGRGTKLELEFTKDGKVNLWKFKLDLNKEKQIDYQLLQAATFNFKKFKDMFDPSMHKDTSTVTELIRKEVRSALKEYGMETMYFANPGGFEQMPKPERTVARFTDVEKWKIAAQQMGAVIRDRGDDWIATLPDTTVLGTFNKMISLGSLS